MTTFLVCAVICVVIICLGFLADYRQNRRIMQQFDRDVEYFRRLNDERRQ